MKHYANHLLLVCGLLAAQISAAALPGVLSGTATEQGSHRSAVKPIKLTFAPGTEGNKVAGKLDWGGTTCLASDIQFTGTVDDSGGVEVTTGRVNERCGVITIRVKPGVDGSFEGVGGFGKYLNNTIYLKP